MVEPPALLSRRGRDIDAKPLLRDFSPSVVGRHQVIAGLKQSKDKVADLASQKARTCRLARRSFLRASFFRATSLSRKAVRAARPWPDSDCFGVCRLWRLVVPRGLPSSLAVAVLGLAPLGGLRLLFRSPGLFARAIPLLQPLGFLLPRALVSGFLLQPPFAVLDARAALTKRLRPRSLRVFLVAPLALEVDPGPDALLVDGRHFCVEVARLGRLKLSFKPNLPRGHLGHRVLHCGGSTVARQLLSGPKPWRQLFLESNV